MQAIVTGMRECSESVLVQEMGLKLVVDTCLALSSCAEVPLQCFGGQWRCSLILLAAIESA